MTPDQPMVDIVQAAEYMEYLESEFEMTSPEEKGAVAMFYLGDQLSRVAEAMEQE